MALLAAQDRRYHLCARGEPLLRWPPRSSSTIAELWVRKVSISLIFFFWHYPTLLACVCFDYSLYCSYRGMADDEPVMNGIIEATFPQLFRIASSLMQMDVNAETGEVLRVICRVFDELIGVREPSPRWLFIPKIIIFIMCVCICDCYACLH